jgi:hypothetical protein
MRLSLSLKRKPLLTPEPRQRVRLRAGRGPWRGNFRAISEPFTDEAGEVVVRVVKEKEYQDAMSEDRRAVGTSWPVRQIEAISAPEEDERTQELPGKLRGKLSERAEPRPATRSAQEGAVRAWWRRMF